MNELNENDADTYATYWFAVYDHVAQAACIVSASYRVTEDFHVP